jgi:hypothetical protein
VNKQNRILLGALGVQIALVLLFQLRSDSTTIGRLEPLLPEFKRANVTRIQVFDRTAKGDEDKDKAQPAAKPGEKPSVVIAKQGPKWVLASHFNYPVEDQRVSDLLEKIEGLRSRGPIASGAARQKQLEVADDSYERKVVLSMGSAVDLVLYVGANAGSRQTSVRVAGQSDVHGVTGLTSFGVGAKPANWVDTSYFDVADDKIASIDLVNANGTFHFERSGPSGGWTATVGGEPLKPPAGMELNTGEIGKVVSRATKIFMADPADPKRVVDKPLATVTLHVKQEQAAAAHGEESPTSKLETVVDRTLELASTDQKDRTYVHEKGRPQAVLVDALSVTDLAEVSRDRLLAKIGEKKPDASPGEGMPAEGMPEGLPPGLIPEQPGQ